MFGRAPRVCNGLYTESLPLLSEAVGLIVVFLTPRVGGCAWSRGELLGQPCDDQLIVHVKCTRLSSWRRNFESGNQLTVVRAGECTCEWQRSEQSSGSAV